MNRSRFEVLNPELKVCSGSPRGTIWFKAIAQATAVRVELALQECPFKDPWTLQVVLFSPRLML
jgi:hypothetical protein